MYQYTTHGTCSSEIHFDIDENHLIHNVSVVGGCNGNLKGIGKLVEGRKAEEIISLLEGNTCGMKSTSCPDQLARALKQAIGA